MKTAELDYHLPPELIAQQPAPERSGSRLLVLDRQSPLLLDRHFHELGEFVRAGDCMVLNTTRVLPARFYAAKRTGARIEGLFLDEPTPGMWHVLLKNARRLTPGDLLELLGAEKEPCCGATVRQRLNEGAWLINVENSIPAHALLEKIGIMPLPPYIKREQNDIRTAADKQRYQTVYASTAGAVAAPTAGLHFTPELMAQLEKRGIRFARLTLHVGIGTFKPVTVDDLKDHTIHSEYYELDEVNAAIINETKHAGGRIIAVGTTSVRTLETVAQNGTVIAQRGSTQLFIQPRYAYKIVDAMITNFHLPRSTLLALVGAFAGMDRIMQAYRHAVEHRYRFFSYGDAMLII